MSGFRGSNLTKTMASLQDLESFEPLNPLTPDPDFGNLFCVFRQAIGKFLVAIPFFRASYWEIQHRAGPQICSLLASYREIAHNAENCSYSLVYCCKYNCLLGIALPQKTFLQRFYKPKKPFEKFLRAPMEDQGTKDGAVTGSKADQKKDSTEGPLSETEVCSDFGFIEPALKCLHTAYKFCNRTQYPCAGILLRQATGFDGHPAASNSAMPCPGARPALADRAPPSMPEIATGLAPKGTVHCAYMISAVTVGAKCNSC